jgi:hypothetical protein
MDESSCLFSQTRALNRDLSFRRFAFRNTTGSQTKFLSLKFLSLSLVPTPGEIAPQYQTTVISSDDVAATVALKGSHEQGAPACSSHVWRIPFKGVILASVLALSVAFTFGWYRSTDLDITELSGSAVADTWDAEGIVEFTQIYASGPQMSAYLIESLEGKFYYGKTLLCSLVYPIPVLGKPYRDISGPGIFNELIYGDTEMGLLPNGEHSVDQVIPLDGELYINFHLAGVVLGNVLLGCFLAWLQGRFVAAPNPVESYAWLMMALWTVFPGSLSVTSQIYVYSFWPIYSYFLAKRLWSWNSVTASHRDQTAVTRIRERRVA